MSSWWGPTWISVRCRGKSEWTSSPVGSAQTQRRAQMRAPTPATPKHPCQVKTTPSEPQIDRQAAIACQLLCTASQVPRKATNVFSLPSWFWSCQKYQHLSNHSISGFNPCPLCAELAPIPSILQPPAQRGALASTAPPPVDDRGQAFPGACLCLSSLHPTGEVVIWRQLVGCVCKGLVTVRLYGDNGFLIKYSLISAGQFQWWHLSLQLLIGFPCSYICVYLLMWPFRCKAPYETGL